ncbi:MAG: TerC family protein [Saprospiraceae bacterium]|nr:TerC family protein [Candidatus Defluviibacterium haderslevense]
MTTEPIFWILFLLFMAAMLALDLGLFNKKSQDVSFKKSLLWTTVWIGLAMIFNLIVYQWKGPDKAVEFLTGYLIELSLSVDNLFVFILIFGYFHVPTKYQHKILFWGIIGALIFRAIFIFAGVALLNQFHWMIYLFGGILVISGIKMLFQSDKKLEPEKNPILNLFKRFFPVAHHNEGSKFFIKQAGKWFATPLFLVLILVETTDVIFAVDSVPAILAITTDTFIVFTSNAFAILGLRSLFFSLAGIIKLFRFLHYGLAGILIFIGLKMVLADVYKIPIMYALISVLSILVISVLASLLIPANNNKTSTPNA